MILFITASVDLGLRSSLHTFSNKQDDHVDGFDWGICVDNLHIFQSK